MTENQKLREALHKAKAALSLALSDVDWRKDSPTQPVIHKAYNCAHQALALPTAEQVDDINVAESFTSVTKTAAPAQEVGLTDEWAECKRISELPEVDEALRLFAEGETSEDQAVAIVQTIAQALRAKEGGHGG